MKASINSILRLPHIPARAKYLGIPLFLFKEKEGYFHQAEGKNFS
jgi:hypothetical protein